MPVLFFCLIQIRNRVFKEDNVIILFDIVFYFESFKARWVRFHGAEGVACFNIMEFVSYFKYIENLKGVVFGAVCEYYFF